MTWLLFASVCCMISGFYCGAKLNSTLSRRSKDVVLPLVALGVGITWVALLFAFFHLQWFIAAGVLNMVIAGFFPFCTTAGSNKTKN